jgi:Swiss Army Knife RNA repair-like protein
MISSVSTASAYGAGMEPSRPLVLVDVDGVLNPARSQAPGYRRQWVFPGGLARRLLLNPSHGPMLTELAAVAGAELVWATYWRNRANTWIAPRVGLPPLRFVPIPRRWIPPAGYSLGTWKSCHVAAWVGPTPFVWFEDDARAVSHIAGQQSLGHHLMVKVDPAIGLTNSHVQRARAWLDDLR